MCVNKRLRQNDFSVPKCDWQAYAKHFQKRELQEESVWAKFAHTAADGKVYDVDYYNLNVIK